MLANVKSSIFQHKNVRYFNSELGQVTDVNKTISSSVLGN